MKERLEQKVGIVPIKMSWDKAGAIINYCSYRHHPGVIVDEKIVSDCIKKECRHYRAYREFLKR